MVHVFYTAAHGGFDAESAPLGGGAAVASQLVREWTRTQPFPFTLLGPGILGSGAPTAHDLVRLGELQYARFCRDFERATTAEILKHDPARTVVLANDISEGPSFGTLAARGFRVHTIYHVDVVAYVASIYGRALIQPQTTVQWFNAL